MVSDPVSYTHLGTLSTCMYYTGIDPRTMQPVYVPRDPHEKAMQRALMQWKRPEKRPLVREALHRTHRADLIGYGKGCLLRPNGPARPGDQPSGRGKPAPAKGKAQPTRSRPAKKVGWAVAKPKKMCIRDSPHAGLRQVDGGAEHRRTGLPVGRPCHADRGISEML